MTRTAPSCTRTFKGSWHPNNSNDWSDRFLTFFIESETHDEKRDARTS